MKHYHFFISLFIIFLLFSHPLYPRPASKNNVTITWDMVTEDIDGNPEEIIYYYIYCGDTPYLEPVPELLVGATSKSSFRYYDDRLLDPEIALYFLVTAVDGFGNESGFIPEYTLPVELTAFTLSEENGVVLINWTTQSEKDILGYNIYKSTEKSKNYKKINPSIIKSKGILTSLTEYAYQDSSATPLQVAYYKLESVQINGQTTQYETKSIYVTNGKPDRYALTQNYPNPFNPHTTIDYSVPEDGWVQVLIYNARGERIKELVNYLHPAGVYSIQWDASNQTGVKVSSGVYFYKIITKDFTEIKRMILTK